MAATYVIVYASGTDGNPVWNNVGTNLRFRTDDTNTQDSTNPLVKPTSGQNHSFWKSIAVQWSGTYTQVSNFRLYVDGNISWALGTNGGLFIGDQSLTDSQYVQATGTVGTSGNEVVASHANITSKSNAENYTSSNPMIFDSNTYTADGTSKHVVLQVTVDSDAQQGLLPSENIYFVVDEL